MYHFMDFKTKRFPTVSETDHDPNGRNKCNSLDLPTTYGNWYKCVGNRTATIDLLSRPYCSPCAKWLQDCLFLSRRGLQVSTLLQRLMSRLSVLSSIHQFTWTWFLVKRSRCLSTYWIRWDWKFNEFHHSLMFVYRRSAQLTRILCWFKTACIHCHSYGFKNVCFRHSANGWKGLKYRVTNLLTQDSIQKFGKDNTEPARLQSRIINPRLSWLTRWTMPSWPTTCSIALTRCSSTISWSGNGCRTRIFYLCWVSLMS